MKPLSRRIIGPSATFGSGTEVSGVDLTEFIQRLLLFDEYVLYTIRLKEFPYLVRHFGYAGLRDLLQSRVLEIRCECFQVVQVGQSGLFGDPILPAMEYAFNWVDTHNHSDYVASCLSGLNSASGISSKQASNLKEFIARSIVRVPLSHKQEIFPAFEHDLLFRNELLTAAIRAAMSKRGLSASEELSSAVEKTGEGRYSVRSNVGALSGLPVDSAHSIVGEALLAIAGLNQRIAEMKTYSALSGFGDDDIELFNVKLDFLADVASGTQLERQFGRVISIAGIPEPSPGTMIDMEKILKARESTELRLFRDWLQAAGGASDAEIRDAILSLKGAVGNAYQSSSGRIMRFLVPAIVGFIPGFALAAIGLSAADQFLLDRLLPSNGAAAFISTIYPSLFDRVTQ